MTGPEMLSISLAIKSPGTIDTQTVGATLETPLHKDKYGAWVNENQGKCLCELCQKPIEVLRRHYWMGLPRRHQSCHSKEMMRLRNHRDDGLLTGAALARKLGVGDSTIGRWKRSGRLPKPFKQERGTDLWHLDQFPQPLSLVPVAVTPR